MKLATISISILFLFFSCSKQKKNQKSQEDFCAKIHEKSHKGLSEYFDKYSENLQNKTAVQVLEDGGGSLITRAWFTQNAQKKYRHSIFYFFY